LKTTTQHVSLLAIAFMVVFSASGYSETDASATNNQSLIAIDDSGQGFTTNQYNAFTTANVLANDSSPEGNLLFVSGFDTSQTKGKVDYLVPGSLDETFGTSGKVVTNAGGNSNGNAVALQPDGKIVVVGYSQGSRMSMVRYLPDGSLDPGFGQNGIVIDDYAYSPNVVGSNPNLAQVVNDPKAPQYGVGTDGSAVAIQTDGKIVVAGMLVPAYEPPNYYSLPEVFVARYDAAGKIDPTFNGNGFVATKIGQDDRGLAIALQEDGKIVVGGKSGNDFAVLRYLSNGQLDASFNGKGWATIDFGGTEWGRGLAIQKDGRIVIAGNSYTEPESNYSEFVLARYDPNGSLDASFDDDGTVVTDFGSTAMGYALAIQPDQKIVVAGDAYSLDKSNWEMTLVRYNHDGSLDASFNGDGKVISNFDPGSYGRAIALQEDGKILVAGSGYSNAYYGFGLARFNPDGNLDLSFNHGQIAVVNQGVKDFGLGIAVQPDGKTIMTGLVSQMNYGTGVVRFNGDGTFAYDPNCEFNELLPGQQTTDTFTYTASDGVLTDTATVTITIEGIARVFFPIIAK